MRTPLVLSRSQAERTAASSSSDPANVAEPVEIPVDTSNIQEIPKAAKGGLPFREAILITLTIQSALGLAGPNELGGLLTRLGDPTLDIAYFSTFFDAAFLAYGTNVLLNQAGIVKEEPPTTTKATLNNMECQLNLDVGREPNTWMPKEWGASGARLSLPLTVRFSDELVDVGYPTEEALNPAGSRYAKRVYCDGGRFLGTRDGQIEEIVVEASGGAWSADPLPFVPGASTLNFFLDFPKGASRNE